jgi:hypothetical protein
MVDSTKICSKCNAEIQTGSKFCMECGTPTEDTPNEVEVPKTGVKCPECNAPLKEEDKFCTECGAKIEPITNCPKCNAEIKPGTSFCTECGTNIYEYQPSPEPSSSIIQTGNNKTDVTSASQPPKRDDPMEDLKETGMGLMKDVEKTGKGLMKDLGGFLDKSSNKSSKKTIKPTKKEQRFLVCNKCSGYYELQKGESAEDYSLECDCGGHLEEKTSI